MPKLNKIKDTDQKAISDIQVELAYKRGQLMLKRSFDVIASLLGLTILFPLLIVISFLIKLDSRGPVFFKQIRVGKEGKDFRIYKFRTMVVDAESKGMQITVGKDKRITKSGHFLRRFKLDELPQLINVLKGEMSFVGPRPEVPKYVNLYNSNQRSILNIRPGITDYASIKFIDENQILGSSINPEEIYIKEIMPKKLELNLVYLRKISLVEDIRIILKTIKKILF